VAAFLDRDAHELRIEQFPFRRRHHERAVRRIDDLVAA
jgi:hypothetical protein